MSRRSSPVRAFSLVELVLILAIIGVLAAIGTPRYANSLALYRVQAAAARIAADLNYARSRARTTSLGQSVVFDLTANRYTLPGVAGLNGLPTPYAVTLASEPYAATLTAAAFSASPTLSFDRYGQAAAGGSVTVRSGPFTKSVAVDAVTGLASVQ